MIAAWQGVEERPRRAWTWLLPPRAGGREPSGLSLEVRCGRLSPRSTAPGSRAGQVVVACPLDGAAATTLRGAVLRAPSLRRGPALQLRLGVVDGAGAAADWPHLSLRGRLVSWLRHPEDGCWTLDGGGGLWRALLTVVTHDDAGGRYFATVDLRLQ